MNQGFGHEMPQRHADAPHRPVSRWLVVIASGDVSVARLFVASREQVGEFDAATEEVTTLVRDATASAGAAGPEWDRALVGHTRAEREAATVYALAT
ncbi:MAG: hypothetical protein KBC73_10850 [Burkholderiaceae bacterium]|nr:hypothetical protein [Burkholderiaceae bacterium]